jgi:hypothetical protein
MTPYCENCAGTAERVDVSASIDIEKAFWIVEQMPLLDVASLEFPNVRGLEPRVARVLSTGCGSFVFSGLEQLSAEAVEALARRRGGPLACDYLAFPKLAWLGEEVAIAFGMHQCDLLLDGVTSLTPAEAAGLAQHSGKLGLPNLATLSHAVAECLAAHRGPLLQLGVRTLDDDAAEAIAKYRGELHLLNLEHMSVRAAEAFVARQSRLPKALEELMEHAAVMRRIEWRKAGRLAVGSLKHGEPAAIAALQDCAGVVFCDAAEE